MYTFCRSDAKHLIGRMHNFCRSDCLNLRYRLLLYQFDQCGRCAVHPTYKTVNPTYKMFASDLKKVGIRPTKVVHPTYKLLYIRPTKLYIRPTKSLHPAYKSCASDLQICVQRGTAIQMVALSTTY